MGRKEKTEGPELELEKGEIIPRYGFERLCSAVVAQAAKDKAWWFFESEAIKLYLSERVDPRALMYQIKENYKIYGRWSATDTKADAWLGKVKEDDIL